MDMPDFFFFFFFFGPCLYVDVTCDCQIEQVIIVYELNWLSIDLFFFFFFFFFNSPHVTHR